MAEIDYAPEQLGASSRYVVVGLGIPRLVSINLPLPLLSLRRVLGNPQSVCDVWSVPESQSTNRYHKVIINI